MPIKKPARNSANPNDGPGGDDSVLRFNLVTEDEADQPPLAGNAYEAPPTAFYEELPPKQAPPPYMPPPITPPPTQSAAYSTPSPAPAPPASTPILSGSDILRTAARAAIWCGVALLFHGVFDPDDLSS